MIIAESLKLSEEIAVMMLHTLQYQVYSNTLFWSQVLHTVILNLLMSAMLLCYAKINIPLQSRFEQNFHNTTVIT